MKTVESILDPISSYLISMTRNTIEGWYELEIGIPKLWAYDQNNEIGIEMISKTDEGNVLKIFPKNRDVVIDDLFAFVKVIIETNEKIAEKEIEFSEEMQEMKNLLEQKAQKFYKEIDELKDNSFKNANDNFTKNLHSVSEEKKETRGRKSKDKTESGKIENFPVTGIKDIGIIPGTAS